MLLRAMVAIYTSDYQATEKAWQRIHRHTGRVRLRRARSGIQ